MNINDFDEQDDESGGSAGGQTGEIHFRFHDAFSSAPRDDILSPDEARRRLLTHGELLIDTIKKQKETRREYAAIKEGRVTLTEKRRLGMGSGSGGGTMSQFKEHPISKKFSGKDNKTNPLPNNELETNRQLTQELDLRNRHRMGMSNAPRLTRR